MEALRRRIYKGFKAGRTEAPRMECNMKPFESRHRICRKLTTCLLGVGTFLMAQSATTLSSQAAICMSRDNLVTYLSERHSESPRALGLVADRGLMEVYVSPQGTWTIAMTTAQGVACILAVGDTWEENMLRADAGTEF